MIAGTEYRFVEPFTPAERPLHTETPGQRVHRGAAWLDVSNPGWVDRIDFDNLYMADTEWCILGQLYGTFDNHPLMQEICPSKDCASGTCPATLWAGDHGFDHIASDLFSPTDRDADYRTLTQLWKALIELRRLEATVARVNRLALQAA